MTRAIRQWVVVVVLLGLGLTALFASAAAQIERGGPKLPTPTPAPTVPGATPTMDRLAPPPTVPAPNQADEGAQLYWLHCQPCHGDVGQGLTDDWRAQYPPEDQYCWNSGCHGPQPYHQDFALPTAVPAIIGEGALTKFPTLDSVYRYVSVAMPYFFPGDLTQEEYLAILAHLARANGLWDGRPLTVDSLSQYAIPGAIAGAPTPTLPAVARVTPALVVAPSAVPTSAALATGQPARTGGMGAAGRLVLFGGVFVLLALGGFVLWLRRSRSS